MGKGCFFDGGKFGVRAEYTSTDPGSICGKQRGRQEGLQCQASGKKGIPQKEYLIKRVRLKGRRQSAKSEGRYCFKTFDPRGENPNMVCANNLPTERSERRSGGKTSGYRNSSRRVNSPLGSMLTCLGDNSGNLDRGKRTVGKNHDGHQGRSGAAAV